MTLSILDAARDSPSRLALIGFGEQLTFAALAERVVPVMERLKGEGIDGSSLLPRAAITGSNDVDTVCTILALIELGEPFVLLHPRLTPRERTAILADLCAASGPGAESVPVGRVFDTRLSSPPPALAPGGPSESCLAVLYTSGTSGRAKGAILSRRAFIASAEASAKNLGWFDQDRWLACLPLAHVGALSIVTRCLLARRTLVLETAAIDRIAATIERESVTIASLVPTLLRRLFDSGWTPPAWLRAILLGGAGAHPSLIEEARARGAPVLTTYGLTEACSQVTTQRYGTPPSVEAGAGEPLDGVELRLHEGEIQVRGPTLMSGYFPLGAHPDPFLPDGFLATGDLGHLDASGRLHVLARRTDLIVTGGENVYPAEVEQALLGLTGVAGAAVFGIPDETWGQSVAAALVPVEATPPSDDALAAHLAARLAPFKWPRSIAFLPELRVSERSGKIDRAAVAREAAPLLRPLAFSKRS